MTVSPYGDHNSMNNGRVAPPRQGMHNVSLTRRDFLAGLGAIGGGAVVLSSGNWLTACSPMSRELKPDKSTQIIPLSDVLSQDFKFAVSVQDEVASIVDMAKQKKISTLVGPKAHINFSPLLRRWSANNQYLMLIEDQPLENPLLYLDIYDIYAGKKLYTRTIADDKMMSSAWSPDNTRIALAGKDTVTLWDGTNGKVLSETIFKNPLLNIEVLSWSPDGKRLALATVEGSDESTKKLSVKIWNSQTRTIVAAFDLPTERNVSLHGFVTLAWSPRGSLIAALLSDQKVWLIRPSGKSETFALDTQVFENAFMMAWSPDDSYLAIPNADKAEIWNIAQRLLAYTLPFSHPDVVFTWSSKNVITTVEAGDTLKTWTLP